MKKGTIFTKHLPNVKLRTRLDAEGCEIEVEVREDEESTRKQQEIMDVLLANGYYRAYIKNLSAFNKIVGGMVWCIDACDHDVDVDLLFHEGLSIGQQISLTEKIIAVLPQMSCPYQLEPHQIQGLDVIHILPVIQWLCKTSAENRREKAKKLKEFAVGQFHNSFQLPSDVRQKRAQMRMLENIRRVEGLFGPQRKYRRNLLEFNEADERTRVHSTLLEYGNFQETASGGGGVRCDPELKSKLEKLEAESRLEEIDVDVLLKALSITGEEEIDKLELTETNRMRLKEHFATIKAELEMDSDELRIKNQLTELEDEKVACETELTATESELETLRGELEELSKAVEDQQREETEHSLEIQSLNERETSSDKSVLDTVQELIKKNEQVKREEQEFKETCRVELAKMQTTIEEETEKAAFHGDVEAMQQELKAELDQLQSLRIRAAKQNRQLSSVQRQLDNIPDRTELAQYQKRFLELYNQVSAKHRETKQFFSLYNTLSQTKTCLDKELSLLNSIFDNYQQAMGSSQAKAEFLKQLEAYVESIGSLKTKQKQRFEAEKAKRDQMNATLLGLVDEQRHLAAIIKQLKQEFTRNDQLTREYKVLLAQRQ